MKKETLANDNHDTTIGTAGSGFLILDYRSRAWVSVEHAKQILSCGRTRIYELIKQGQLVRIKNGNSTRITVASLMQFVSAAETCSAQN